MKAINIYSLLTAGLLCAFGSNASAQDNGKEGDATAASEITFGYDASGNRVSRNTIVLKEVLAEKDKEEEEGKEAETMEEANKEVAEALETEVYGELLLESQISIYPNPTKGMLKIDISNLSGKDASLALYNLNGVEIQRKESLEGSNKIDLSSQPKGTYIMKVFLNGEQSTWKIIKE